MTIADSNTLTADGTEQTLATETTAGTYILTVDINAMADGDSVIVRVKTRILIGGATRTIFHGRAQDAQGEDKLIQSIPVIVGFECIATLEQEAGTNRDFPWTLERL